MKRSFLFAATLIFALLSFNAKGQIMTLSVNGDSTSITPPDPIYLGDSINYNFVVVNTGQDTLMDSIFIMQRIDTAVYQIGGYFKVMVPQDTLMIGIKEQVLSPKFGGGVHVVVIWPTAPSHTTTDSIKREITFIDTLTWIGEPGLPQYKLDAYPNPTQNKLNFRAKFPPHVLLGMEMYESTGKLIDKWDHLPDFIEMNNYPHGIYFLHARFDKGQTKVFKLIRY